MRIIVKKHLLLFTLLLVMGFTQVGWGDNITPIRTDVAGFATWTDVSVGGTTYLQLLVAGASTTTPAMNFDNYTAEKLDFKARTYGGLNATENTITVWISTDNGGNWTNLGTRIPTSTTLTAMTQFDLSTYDGTQVQVKFTVAGTSNSIGAGIDDISITGTVATSNSTASDIIVFSGYTYPTNIDYKSYQATDITNSSNDLEVAKFTIRDGGATTDADALGTTLTSITFSVGNYANIRRIALYDGITEIGSEVAGATSVTFSSLTLAAADGGTKDFTVRVSFNSTVTDNQNIQFTITSATADVAGSIFATASAGGATTDNTGNNNKIAVTADRLAYSSNKPSATVSTATNFTVEVKATDVNNNTDVDQTPSVTLSLASGSGSLSSLTGLTQSLVAGVYTWNDVQYSVGGSFSILASDGVGTGLTDITSNTITAQDNNLTENFDYGVSDNADLLALTSNWTRHSGTTGPGYSATGLTYTDYASSGVGGNVTFIKTNSGDINRTFSTINSNSTVYISCLVNLSAATSADYFFHLGPTTIGTTYVGKVYATSSGAGWIVGLQKTTDTRFDDATVLNFNQTYLLILKYVFSTATTSDDQVGLWIYDSGVPSTEGSGSPLVTIALTGGGTAGDPSDLGSVAIREGTNTAAGSIDGIRVGTAWGQAPLPVELTSFSASAHNCTVNLSWKTATELNNYGFDIERTVDLGDKVSMVSVWEKVGFVNGAGNSNSPKEYSFTDKSAASGKYLYRLKQLDNDGQYTYSKEVEVDLGTPTAFALEQNYPNPFNPTTSIQYSVVSSQNVTIKVFNVLGKEVALLVNEKQEPGTYTVEFSTANLASGTYIYRMQSGEFVQTKKMIVLK
ncbi:MAG: T9SS type A sorting domain-containing protein [Ignavibacteria bacterium]|nr:T9SS type A sorting domain-containing protein [Ignavibacteria bacterium]